MRTTLEIAVVLTTYERPGHLARSLRSLALQTGVADQFEVIVADDGSQDNTAAIVQEFARTVNFPVQWITHPHDGFRVSLCRNDGVRSSRAPYFLFTDSDCIFPPDHLLKHLQARRPGIVRAGECIRLEREASERIDLAAIDSGAYRSLGSLKEWRRLKSKRIKDSYYFWINHACKPKLPGYNIAISRDDLEAVNGFDESFVGWGCEDDDIAFRLRRAGRRIASALGYTHAYHLWHPTDPSRPAKWNDGLNVSRLHYMDRPIRCANGLVNTSPARDVLPPEASSEFSLPPLVPKRAA